MGQILWSDRAESALRRLTPSARGAIEKRLGYLRSMPRMYAVAGDPHFPGCRSFWTEAEYCDLPHDPQTGPGDPDVYCVYYMVAAGGTDCYIVDIVPADREEAAGA
jgi:hypothetical protein